MIFYYYLIICIIFINIMLNINIINIILMQSPYFLSKLPNLPQNLMPIHIQLPPKFNLSNQIPKQLTNIFLTLTHQTMIILLLNIYLLSLDFV